MTLDDFPEPGDQAAWIAPNGKIFPGLGDLTLGTTSFYALYTHILEDKIVFFFLQFKVYSQSHIITWKDSHNFMAF